MTETNAEWLEGIRWVNAARPLTREEAHRLIEQVERVQELEKLSAEWETETYIQDAKNKRLEKEYKRLHAENTRRKAAYEYAKMESGESGACKADEDIPDDDKELAYRTGAEDMLNDFTDFYQRALEDSE